MLVLKVVDTVLETIQNLALSFICQFYENRFYIKQKKKAEDELEYIHLSDNYLPKFTGQYILNETEPKQSIIHLMFYIFHMSNL